MSIAIPVLVLVAYGYALLVWPEYRLPMLAAGVLLAVGLGLYFWRQEPESERAAERIAPDELVFDQVTLARSGRGATLSGRVTNHSPRYRLREVTLGLRLRDCADAAVAPATCPVIGESQAIARPDVPAGQIRAFAAHFVFANVPPIAGTLRWDWNVAAIRATE